MRTLYLFFAALIITISGSVNLDKEKDIKQAIEGVWELESAQYSTPDTTINVTAENWKQMKIFTGSHFVWIGQAPGREKFSEPGGTEAEFMAAAGNFGAGGGTFTIDGDNAYTEHIEYTLNPNWEGASIEFTFEMEGNDRWVQRGTLPTKSLNMSEYDTELYEVWRRVSSSIGVR